MSKQQEDSETWEGYDPDGNRHTFRFRDVSYSMELVSDKGTHYLGVELDNGQIICPDYMGAGTYDGAMRDAAWVLEEMKK